jgi:Predicted transcriptional regulator
MVSNEIAERIAGEIAISENPGSVMKKWRELFGISQVDLSKEIKISTSTISDYESSRRLSPGVGVIRRFVNALMKMDDERGGTVIQNLSKFSAEQKNDKPIYVVHDFVAPLSGTDLLRIVEGKAVAGHTYLDNIKIFGYTKVDSLRVILDMMPSEYPKLFGSTTERVFIFENVSTGRSPMIVIRVAPIKPKLVLIQGIVNVDKLAIKIAQIEKIPILTTKLSTEELETRLGKI